MVQSWLCLCAQWISQLFQSYCLESQVLAFQKCKSARLSSSCLLIHTVCVEDECLKNLLHVTFLKCAFQKDSRYPAMLSPKCCQTIIVSRLCVLHDLETKKHAFKWKKSLRTVGCLTFFFPFQYSLNERKLLEMRTEIVELVRTQQLIITKQIFQYLCYGPFILFELGDVLMHFNLNIYRIKRLSYILLDPLSVYMSCSIVALF